MEKEKTVNKVKVIISKVESDDLNDKRNKKKTKALFSKSRQEEMKKDGTFIGRFISKEED
mgnify:CR=1 FL=1